MSRNKLGRVAGTFLCAAISLVTLGCPPSGSVVPKSVVDAVFYPNGTSWTRNAAGGGFVTVDVTVRPGPLPNWNVPPAMPDTIAVLSNRGEGGKNEKRYGLKPSTTATYKLVLSADGSRRTKWTLYEQSGGSLTPHRSGHLWECDHHTTLLRWLAFKDCSLPVTYDSLETAAAPLRGQPLLASYFVTASEALPPQDAAIWISCNMGCCSLGT